MTVRTKGDHLHLRIDRTCKGQILAAASVVGASLSDFVRDATIGKAREILLREFQRDQAAEGAQS